SATRRSGRRRALAGRGEGGARNGRVRSSVGPHLLQERLDVTAPPYRAVGTVVTVPRDRRRRADRAVVHPEQELRRRRVSTKAEEAIEEVADSRRTDERCISANRGIGLAETGDVPLRGEPLAL